MEGGIVAADLFSGAGGLSKGLEMAGFSVKMALDLDPDSSQTYANNLTHTKFIREDVRNLNGGELKKLSNLNGDLRLLAGGAPCQGYSLANTKTRDVFNPNNYLVFDFLRIASEIKPEWLLVENVPGLLSFENGKIKDRMLELSEKMGYSMEWVVLNALNFGVPQNRSRIFFIGNRTGADFGFLEELKEKSVKNPATLKGAIGDLPKIENGNASDELKYCPGRPTKYQRIMRSGTNGKVKNNRVTRNSELVKERYKYINQGENWSHLLKKKPELFSNYKDAKNCHSGIYRRLEWDKPSVAITHFRKSMLIHPEHDRGLSVREAARIQSFPDDYVFYGQLNSQQQQVANAVPPLLAKAVGEKIIEQMH